MVGAPGETVPPSVVAEHEVATLLAREERARLALAAGRIYTWDLDLTADLLVWSDGLEKELLVDRAPGGIASFRNLVHPDDVEFVSKRIEAALRGPRDYEAEFRMIRGDGSVRWCSARAIVVRDGAGRAIRMVGVDQDVTERHDLLRRTLESEQALRDSEARYRSAMVIGRMASWETNYLTGVRKWTPEGLALFGLDLVEGVGTVGGDRDEFLSILHPEDRHLYQAYRDVENRQDSFPAEYRIVRPDGRTRWMSGYGQVVDRSADGRPLRMLNVATDITERKAMEEHTQFLLRELSHRSRNILAVVQAIVTMSSRNAGGAKEFAKTISDRLGSLAASNDMLTDNSWQGALLGDLVNRQIAAFVEMPSPRVSVTGADVVLTADAMQPIGLALHELTTNAIKYGALSGAEGEVRIDWIIESDPTGSVLRLDWTEHGGPRVTQPNRKGFGQVVTKQMIEQALSATATIEYPATGVRWSMRAPASNILGAIVDRV